LRAKKLTNGFIVSTRRKERDNLSIRNQLRQPGRKKQIDGHGMTAPERYAPDTRHMVIMNVINEYRGGYISDGQAL